MKLAWFSPLPAGPEVDGGSRRGGAEGSPAWLEPYWRHLLPELTERAEVTVFAEFTNPPGPPSWIEDRLTVRPIAPSDSFWRQIQQHDLAIYHLADHPGPFAKAFDLLQLHPGLVVLHDPSIHYLVAIIWSLFRKRPEAYFETVRRYGDVSDVDAAKAWAAEGFPQNRGPDVDLLAYLLESALGLAVHSPAITDRLPPAFDFPMAVLDLPFAARPDAGPLPSRSSDSGPFRVWLHTTGELGAFPLLEALAGHPIRARLELRLLAPTSQHSHLVKAVQALQLDEVVTLDATPPFERLSRSTPDLLVDYRRLPHQDHLYELLPLWRRGPALAVAGSPDEPMARRGDVLTIRPDQAFDDMSRHLNWLHGAPEGLAEQGRRVAAAVARRHDPKRYVDRLLELARRAVDQRVPTACRRFAHRAAPRLAWLPPTARPPVRQRISEFLDELSLSPDLRKTESPARDPEIQAIERRLEEARSDRRRRQERLDRWSRELEDAGICKRPAGHAETGLRRPTAALDELDEDPETRRQRLEVYGPQVVETASRFPAGRCLDLRCDTGEWLSILRDHGLRGSGVDPRGVRVEAARARRLDCEVGKPLDLLNRHSNGSVALVTGFHLLELGPDWPAVNRLFGQAFRVLRAGGLAIFEISNLENLNAAAGRGFRHGRPRLPLHPAPVVEMLKAAGFDPPRILRLTHGRRFEPPFEPDTPTPDGGRSGPWLKLLGLLNVHVLSAPDVAMVARKPFE